MEFLPDFVLYSVRVYCLGVVGSQCMNSNGEVTSRHVLVRVYRFIGGGEETRIALINNGFEG